MTEAMTTTLLFLDIDGVLVQVSPMSFGGGDIDERCLGVLQEIVASCGGKDHTPRSPSSSPPWPVMPMAPPLPISIRPWLPAPP